MRRFVMVLAALFLASWTALGLAFFPAARAEGEQAGEFDYYVMALSWSPAWCALEGDSRDDPQCDAGRGLTFILHGLWPQFEAGWPSFCRTTKRDPSQSQTAAMTDIMGGAGLAFYQWKKHGRCSGSSAAAYFQSARAAFHSISLPPLFKLVDQPLTIPASVVEDAFVEANPSLQRDQITVTCKAGRIQEVRICLARDLTPRRCGAGVLQDCRLSDALLEPLR